LSISAVHTRTCPSSSLESDIFTSCESDDGSQNSDPECETNAVSTRDVHYSAGDFVLVKFATKKNVLHYVAELIKETADDADFSESHGDGRHVTHVTEWTVKFMRRKSSAGFKFVYPQADQIFDVPLTDFVLKLPPPDTGAKRHVTFANVDFSIYNLR
jgi:hypothetical protein